MKLDYHPETNSLYIKVAPQPSEEIEEGIVLDYDERGKSLALILTTPARLKTHREIPRIPHAVA